MTASDSTPNTSVADCSDTPDAQIPAFGFPFSPARFAQAKKPATYPGAGKSTHDKTPGRAPNGTRRSMGKR